jgi:hypothetical protein
MLLVVILYLQLLGKKGAKREKTLLIVIRAYIGFVFATGRCAIYSGSFGLVFNAYPRWSFRL